ncbi:armadillo-type protein [Mycena maculata]|uniref:Armadillo-type protein n=1 Tax=Mycena maculata TaxID=230809 RepID=A0AAD7K0H1_9AGAR|nr:armadillo-type protein [Mycena maculata]
MVTIETLVDLTEHEEIRDALGTPETIGKVVGCLADNDEDVRAAAVKALKNLATHDKLRAAIRAPKPLGQLWRMFGLPYSAAATDVLTTLLGHNDFREHFEKPEQVDSVLRNLSDPNWRVRVGMVLVLQVFRTDENLRGLFITTDTTIRLLDFLGNSNTSAVAASTLATLVEYPGPQSNIVAPNSITMILAAVRSEPAKEELTTLIEALIKLDTGIDDVPVLLLTEILRQLPQATPAARTAYTDILKRLPIETIYISSNHVDKLMKLWISSDSAISAIVLQILMRLADNAQFRVLIRPELWDRLSYSIQHEKSGPALETLKGLAHDAETRRKILNSGIVHVLLNMLKSGTSDVDRWQIGLEGLLILDVF